MRILIVDDFEMTRRALHILLLQVGVDQVYDAADGAEALNAVEAVEFDAILCDYEMPVMDGLEFTRIVRARGCRTPIVIVSSHPIRDESIEAGASAYLRKPFLKDDLERVLHHVTH